MRSLLLFLGFFLTVLLFLSKGAMAQQGQTLHIVQGKKVTLRADSKHALSYIWFKNDEPLNGLHDQRIVVVEPGIYTVIALGDGCNSDMSDPVEIILDPGGGEVTVDLEIRNLPEKGVVALGEPFNYQLMVLNNGLVDATDLRVTFDLPASLEYLKPVGSYGGEIDFIQSSRQLLWKLPELKAKEFLSLWVSVKGIADGDVITMAKVTAKEKDGSALNNESDAKVRIVFFQIPNVFTPNGDGKNDTFVIQGLELFDKKRLRVFNRSGFEVYQSENYGNDWNGQGLGLGTYFYILEFEGDNQKSRVIKGYVTILR
ncbi:gliding motility-associated C-terminal domain-containing protein [Sphingobacterium nematocida]|uniref:Gliding motility-associated C-terminal domain-containing protein n=1 Tax=Sphingobacterium nematocida TaxID=1513896 RepID=A0A1T5G4F0_9SPHI|nr:gliding motility-associated C-terminal domain-containing protein [Sphingobacterium nematocida]SKC03343.1 gliding motility-associated C-terminal domain-containing protein [Sphingobacterium nematocida]